MKVQMVRLTKASSFFCDRFNKPPNGPFAFFLIFFCCHNEWHVAGTSWGFRRAEQVVSVKIVPREIKGGTKLGSTRNLAFPFALEECF